jgi:hypothetical protein
MSATEGLTESQLLKKARIALQAMDNTQWTIEVKFISVHILKNGEVIYEINSAKVATWLWQLLVSEDSFHTMEESQ